SAQEHELELYRSPTSVGDRYSSSSCSWADVRGGPGERGRTRRLRISVRGVRRTGVEDQQRLLPGLRSASEGGRWIRGGHFVEPLRSRAEPLAGRGRDGWRVGRHSEGQPSDLVR